MAKKYVVALGAEGRARLRTLVGGGAGWADAAIAGALAGGLATVARVRQAYATGGLDAALHHKRPDREYARTFDDAREARLIALACSASPEGREHGSLRRLADHLVRLAVVAAVSHETVRRAVKQPSSSRT